MGFLRLVLALGAVLVASGHELHPASPLGKAVEAVRTAVTPAKAEDQVEGAGGAGREALAEHFKVVIERVVHVMTAGEKNYMNVVKQVPERFCGNTKEKDYSENALVCHVLKGLPKAFVKAAQRQQPDHYDDLIGNIQRHICKGRHYKEHFRDVCGVLTHLRAGVPPMRRNKAHGDTYEQADQNAGEEKKAEEEEQPQQTAEEKPQEKAEEQQQPEVPLEQLETALGQKPQEKAEDEEQPQQAAEEKPQEKAQEEKQPQQAAEEKPQEKAEEEGQPQQAAEEKPQEKAEEEGQPQQTATEVQPLDEKGHGKSATN